MVKKIIESIRENFTPRKLITFLIGFVTIAVFFTAIYSETLEINPDKQIDQNKHSFEQYKQKNKEFKKKIDNKIE